MATTAQALANRANAQHSTGPKTDAGKAAVSQNATSHGLSSARFLFLRHENPEEFATLLNRLEDEFQPETASEEFLITEMARAQWKLGRIEAIEAAVLAGAGAGARAEFGAAGTTNDPWAAIAAEFQSTAGDALVKLDRYAASARRIWHKSLDTLLKLRAAMSTSDVRYSRVRRNLSDMALNELLSAPMPGEPAYFAQLEQKIKTKPISADLETELQSHKRRDPLFNPWTDATHMSKELRKWFEAA